MVASEDQASESVYSSQLIKANWRNFEQFGGECRYDLLFVSISELYSTSKTCLRRGNVQFEMKRTAVCRLARFSFQTALNWLGDAD